MDQLSLGLHALNLGMLLTGLCHQTGGISPHPKVWKARDAGAMFNIYGDGFHMIGYAVNDHEVSWA